MNLSNSFLNQLPKNLRDLYQSLFDREFRALEEEEAAIRAAERARREAVRGDRRYSLKKGFALLDDPKIKARYTGIVVARGDQRAADAYLREEWLKRRAREVSPAPLGRPKGYRSLQQLEASARQRVLERLLQTFAASGETT